MRAEILKLLRPLRSRLTRQRSLPRIAAALMTGGWLALVAALLTLLGGSFTAGLIGIGIAVGLPLVALAWSLLRPATWQEAAQLVDRRLHLHNRTDTALHLSTRNDGDPFTALQVEDALAKLRQANVKGIQLSAPWERLAGGLMLTLFAVGLIIWGILAPPTAAIQTSGDMQDLRPEVTDRALAEPAPVNSEMLAGGTRLRNTLAPSQHEQELPTHLGDDAAERYFDTISPP